MVALLLEVAMAKDILVMRQKELVRVHVIQQIIKGQIKQIEGAELLGLSDRQVRRIVDRVEKEGYGGIIHKLRGRKSSKRIRDEVRIRVIELCRSVYKGFGPVFSSEKLAERDGIKVSDETLRKWLHEEGLMGRTRKRQPHRQWRERKRRFGELVQLDGSHHAWLEERGPACVLMGYIDDATSKKYGRFYEYEGTMPALDSFKRYIRRYGIPGAVYVDRHGTYQAKRQETLQEQLENKRAQSAFEKAAERLGVKVIHAQSAPAKGRIERSFRTDQDRLVKELRLQNICTIAQANEFLEEYWGRHNRRFSVAPVEAEDFHRPIGKGVNLDSLLSVRTERFVRKDNTIAHGGCWFQILEHHVGPKVEVEEQPDGKLRILSAGRGVTYKQLINRPKPAIDVIQPKRPRKSKVIWHPPLAHPWKRATYQRRIAGGGKLALVG